MRNAVRAMALRLLHRADSRRLPAAGEGGEEELLLPSHQPDHFLSSFTIS